MDQYEEPTYNKKAGVWEYSIEKYNEFTGKIENLIITGDSKFEVTSKHIKYLEHRLYLSLETYED